MKIYNDQDLKYQTALITNLLKACVSVGKSRPHEYEHNHFMLTEALATLVVMKEEIKEET